MLAHVACPSEGCVHVAASIIDLKSHFRSRHLPGANGLLCIYSCHLLGANRRLCVFVPPSRCESTSVFCHVCTHVCMRFSFYKFLRTAGFSVGSLKLDLMLFCTSWDLTCVTLRAKTWYFSAVAKAGEQHYKTLFYVYFNITRCFMRPIARATRRTFSEMRMRLCDNHSFVLHVHTVSWLMSQRFLCLMYVFHRRHSRSLSLSILSFQYEARRQLPYSHGAAAPSSIRYGADRSNFFVCPFIPRAWTLFILYLRVFKFDPVGA